MNERLVNVLRHLAIGSCIVCIIYLLYVAILFGYYLAIGARVSALPQVVSIVTAVVFVTSVLNLLYIIAKRR